MNREIKLRVWDKYTEKLYYSSGLWSVIEPANVDIKLGFSLSNYRYKNCIGYDDLVWQQYTGLNDKNSKEIYEGDIIRGSFFDDGLSLGYTTVVGKIEYNPTRTCFDIIYKQGRTYLWMIKANIEVIGNIFENPELLKQ